MEGAFLVMKVLSANVLVVEDLRFGLSSEVNVRCVKLYADPSLEKEVINSQVLASETYRQVQRLLSLQETTDVLCVLS